MDAIINPILERLRALERAVYGVPPDVEHDIPAQTVHASRMPSTPGMPIAPYDPNVYRDDETDVAMAAEADPKNRVAAARVIEGPEADNMVDDVDEPDDGSFSPTRNADGTFKRREDD
jgi:hypothetical protein